VVKLTRGKGKEGLAALDRAARATPGALGGRARITAAHVLLETGNAAAALEQAQKARREGEADVSNPQGIVLAALAQAGLGHGKEADALAEEMRARAEAVPTVKEKRRYRYLLGELALRRGDAGAAVRELSAAAALLPPRGLDVLSGTDHVPIWFALGTAASAAGDDAKAEEAFARVAASTTERIPWPIPYVRSFYFLGKVQEKRGQADKARESFRRFAAYWKDGDLDRERVAEATARGR
jgi:tetratricopeptide (TPR) repeat protein